MARHQDPCELCERLKACRDGTYAGLIAELETGFAVMGELQFFEGYAVLIAKDPVTELHELPKPRRMKLLDEVALLAEAVATVTQAHKINYESLGNVVHHMHWHIFPRRLTDPDPKAPVWGQMPVGAAGERFRFSADVHGWLRDAIRGEVVRRRGEG